MRKNIPNQANSIEKEINELKNTVAALRAEIDKLQESNTKLEESNTKLKQRNDSLEKLVSNLNEMLVNGRKKMFGSSSEQLSSIQGYKQLSFFNEAETEKNSSAPEPTEETIVKAYSRRPKRTKEEITAALPHKEVTVDFDDDKKVCDICGNPLVCIGREKLRSELNIVPAQVFVIDYYRNVYKCPECEKESDEANILKPEAPVPVMKKSMASPAAVAYAMQEKYQNGVTLFRQEQYWKSMGVELNRNTLSNWVIRSSQWFKPLYDLMLDELKDEYLIHADETELRVLKQDGTPTSSMSRMWVFCSGKYSEKQMALYKYHATRSAKVVEEILGDYSGYLQTDGYAAYSHARKATRIGCWVHARRKWLECLPKGIDKNGSKAAEALSIVEEIFAADEGLFELPENEWKQQREQRLKPLLEKYWDYIERIDAPGGSALQKAANYSINNKEMLNNVLLDARIELTNNKAERAIKPFVIARKNFLFSDTSRGAEASALCFTIIESAKLNNLNVYGYLIYLLTELPKLGENPNRQDLKKLLPWSKEHPEYCNKV